MSNAPHVNVNLKEFERDPYPILKEMRAHNPICYVPELNATLLTQRDDIFINEKKTEIFSSLQPDGLMTQLMGENMMRKDGQEHLTERKAIFPTISPKTVKDIWKEKFISNATNLLKALRENKKANLMTEIAMPTSAHMLKVITGLTNMSEMEMDRTSQGMIDGCSNYIGDHSITDNCNNCTKSIDDHITDRINKGLEDDDLSLLAVQLRAGLSISQTRANIKLAISGGQNEPRDAISGAVATILKHPKQLETSEKTPPPDAKVILKPSVDRQLLIFTRKKENEGTSKKIPIIPLAISSQEFQNGEYKVFNFSQFPVKIKIRLLTVT